MSMIEKGSAAPRWDLILLCAGLAGMTILDLSKITVALPAIDHEFNSGPIGLQLIVAAYIVSYALVLIPLGRLGDSNLRKPIMIGAVMLYLGASIGCALAPGIGLLVASRIAQGVSAGILMPQVLGTMHAALQGPDRGRGFGAYGLTVNASLALGPVLGGALMSMSESGESWRWVFWMNVPIGVAALVAVLRFAPSGTGHPPAGRLHLASLAVFGAALILALFPLVITTGEKSDWGSRWWLLVPACLLALLFVRLERRAPAKGRWPLIDPYLFTLPTYRNGLAIATSWFAANLGIVFVITLFLQMGVGISPFAAGLANVTFAVAAAFTSWFGARRIPQFGRTVVVVGILIALVGLLATALVELLLPFDVVPFVLPVSQALAGCGAGLVISPNQALSLENVDKAKGGSASAVTQLGQRVGNSVGTAACAAVFFGILASSDTLGELGPEQFRAAFAGGLGIVGAFMMVALAVALFDLRSRKRTAPAPAHASAAAKTALQEIESEYHAPSDATQQLKRK